MTSRTRGSAAIFVVSSFRASLAIFIHTTKTHSHHSINITMAIHINIIRVFYVELFQQLQSASHSLIQASHSLILCRCAVKRQEKMNKFFSCYEARLELDLATRRLRPNKLVQCSAAHRVTCVVSQSWVAGGVPPCNPHTLTLS